MKTFCVRNGQIEVGVIEHEGREFSALGASVNGRHVTGYTRRVHADIILTSWCGSTMLACRSEIVERYWTGSLALLFRLTRGRFIVGYALAEDGMLFRGDLLDNCTEDDARATARQLGDCFSELDSEDEEAYDADKAEDERTLNINYCCPKCSHKWQDQWSCACDSECPNCGLKDITALSWDEIDR
jgi:hypothetical protein